ncbi:MAG: tetratricopeptide repeat protein [Lewinellaceae bacterium]|nr:tetratricopeptide repeat protein [Phaeodactylibacter sp.]MCB9041380.1 tetratricopeptide repeat protein [Lewinellaceae bacterium]
MLKRIALLLVACTAFLPLIAQQTTVFTEANEAYKNGDILFEEGVYGKAQQEFARAVQLLLPVNEPEAELLRSKAELNYARCAVRLQQPDGEKLILDFIRTESPNPMASEALVEVADYYYNSKQWDKAIDYLSDVPTRGMTPEQESAVKFKLGYSLFVKKRFKEALANFRDIKGFETEYYYPANYYLGLCYFFEGSYDSALAQFKIVERSSRYRPHIPYYQAQIYFAERRYDELIAYARLKADDPSVRKQMEIKQLLGQAYFEKGQYAQALPYLQAYAESTGKLREEELYQIGYTYYQVGDPGRAIQYLKDLATVDSKIGQHAMYILGDSYLRLNQNANARAAFGNAKRMAYDAGIQEEALWNYAKLSYELNDPREAINALRELRPTSKYFIQSQELMSEIFLNYRDYQQAIEILGAIENKTPKLQETFQKVLYYRGLQLLQNGDKEGAKKYLEQSMDISIDTRTRALAIYWLGDIAHRDESYEASNRLVSQFLTLAKTQSNLPDESSIHTANYTQGYNYLKQNNYAAALGFFEDAIQGIERNSPFLRNQKVKNQVLGDAVLRAGDCLFKRNQYARAVQYYDQAVSKQYAGFVYALYQKAIIEGLLGRTTNKVLSLEQLAKNHPDSEYADDALLQLGATYQEIGQLSKAAEPLKELLRLYRGKSELIPKALIRLGLISYNQGNLDAAISYYKQVFANNPDEGDSNLALAALEEIYVDDLGQADNYFAFLESVRGSVGGEVKDSINFRAAESQFENANYERAVASYTDYLRKFPRGAYTLPAQYHRAESYSVLQQYTQALADYEAVSERGPSPYYVKALEKAAIIAYNHAQDFSKAYSLYSKLETVATSPDMRFEAQLGAMRSAYRAGNTQAVPELARKVANNPNASQLQVSTAQFYLGKMAFDQGDYNNALTAFNEVIRLSDNEQAAEARYLKAYIYYLRRDLETAQQICMNANKESSGYPYWVAKSVILLSDILQEKGDLYNARAALEALLENYKGDQELISEAQRKLQAINLRINQSSRLKSGGDPNTLEMDDGN